MLPRQEFWDSLLSLNGLNRKRFVRRLSGNDRMGEEKEKEEKAEEELGECMIDEKEELPVNPQKEGKDKSKEEKEDGNKEDKGKEKEDKDKEKEDKGKEKEEEKEEESEEEEAIPTNTFLLTNINRPTIDNFTCPLCLSTFKDPRITPCCHVFCNVCLSTLDSFECPLCCEPLPPFLSPMSDDSPSFSSFSSPFPIAWGISKELQTREKEDVVMCECCEGPVDSIMRAVIWCQDCAKVEDCPQHFCTSCADSEHQSKTSRHHRRIPLSEKPPRPPLCPIHHQEHLFFCCLERELVCSGCLESHVGHQVVSVEKQAESVRKLLLGLIFVVGVGGEKREVVPPLVEEVEKEMVEKEIERLEERLEEKKREKEKLEKAILKVKKQNSEFEERMGVLLGEVKGMESYEFVGKGGDLNVTRMRERIEVGVEELLGRKEEEGERRLMELKKRMEEDDMVWVVEQKEREKKKKNVLVKDKKEREKRMEEKKQFRGLLEQQRRNEKEVSWGLNYI